MIDDFANCSSLICTLEAFSESHTSRGNLGGWNIVMTYLEFSTFLFWQHLEVGTDPEGAEFCKVNYFPAASSDLYLWYYISYHMGTRNQITFAYFTNSLAGYSRVRRQYAQCSRVMGRTFFPLWTERPSQLVWGLAVHIQEEA